MLVKAVGCYKVLVIFSVGAMSTESFPSDLKDIKTEDFVKMEGTQMSISNISMDDIVMLSDNFQSLKLGQQKNSK